MRRVAIAVLFVVAFTPALSAQDAPSPGEAWNAYQKELAEARKARDYNLARSIQVQRPREFLERWEVSGRAAEGDDVFHLAEFLMVARRPAEAVTLFRIVASAEDGALRPQACARFAAAVMGALDAGELEGRVADLSIREAESFLSVLAEDDQAALRATIHNTVARCHDRLGRKEPALGHWMAAARENPALAYGAARSCVWALLSGVHDFEGYAANRTRGNAMLAELIEIKKADLRRAREGGNEQAVKRGESQVERMEAMGRPLEMLGRPAPAWTTTYAWSDTKSLDALQGNVVLIDFWATWCPWCIRSFPALRDLLRDYGDQDLAVIGVTAAAGYVTDARYDLDEDLKERHGQDPKPEVARLPRGEAATDEAVAAFRKTEIELIGKFIANHEMSWPVVMIDPTEPAAKYALSGWPHAVVLDRQGRVRYFKRGALLRDRKEQVAKFREVLDALLAE